MATRNEPEKTRAVWLNFSFSIVFGGIEIMINWGQFLPERNESQVHKEPGYELYMSCREGRMYRKNDTNILTISA